MEKYPYFNGLSITGSGSKVVNVSSNPQSVVRISIAETLCLVFAADRLQRDKINGTVTIQGGTKLVGFQPDDRRSGPSQRGSIYWGTLDLG